MSDPRLNNPADYQEILALTRTVIALLDAWRVRDSDQLLVLALPAGTRVRAIRKYRTDTPFPDDEKLLERVQHLLGISEALRTSYPHNPAYGSMWMRQPHRVFGQRTPLDTILQDGLAGLLAVRSYLDCSFDWQTDAAANK